MRLHGGDLIKSWAKEQKQTALSSGEAELYAANAGAAEGLGLQSLARDFGIEVPVDLEVDASAAVGIIQRRGLGKLRHIETQELWTQQALKMGKFKLKRINTKDNTSDIGTKPVNRNDMEKHLRTMGYECPSCQK